MLQALWLPRIIGMIGIGIALTPVISLGILNTCAGVEHAVNPASTIRAFALLIALARGAFGLQLVRTVQHSWCMGMTRHGLWSIITLSCLPVSCQARCRTASRG
jgi:hypothetical protein